MSLLRVESLRTRFDGGNATSPAVDGVSFSVEEGEALGIVGESGCGKTVTALSLVGLLPEAGRILSGSSVRLRGKELVGAPPRELRRVRGNRIAMVFQEPMTSLNPVLTVGHQVREAVLLHRGVDRGQAREIVVELFREVGIPDPAGRFSAYPHQLSGGMRQRVMIAVALASEPELLVADEPTTALDVTIQAQILELLGELRRRRGMALLLITHDLGVVGEVCDRVLVMYAGQVVEEGTVGAIFRSPRHPYTRGLLDSLPRLGGGGRHREPGDPGGRRARLRAIPGTVPGPDERPEGCRFGDRCPHAWARCLEPPPLFAIEGGGGGPRASRCWLEAEEGASAARAPRTGSGSP